MLSENLTFAGLPTIKADYFCVLCVNFLFVYFFFKFEIENKTKPKKDNRVRRTNVNWSASKIQKLIEEVQQHESLWNVASSVYKDRDRKELS